MSPPDWERADRLRSQADQPGADESLARRLSRLPSTHPSAWPARDRADAEYWAQDREEWWRPAPDTEPDDAEPDDAEPDDAELADIAPDDAEPDDDDPDDAGFVPGDAGRSAAPVRGGRRSEASVRWGELGGPQAISPYRPWFSAEGAADPWFAARETK